MKVTLVLAVFCIASAVAEPKPAINQVTSQTTVSTKPGRFLSLPVPDKCVKRKYKKKFIQNPYFAKKKKLSNIHILNIRLTKSE